MNHCVHYVEDIILDNCIFFDSCLYCILRVIILMNPVSSRSRKWGLTTSILQAYSSCSTLQHKTTECNTSLCVNKVRPSPLPLGPTVRSVANHKSLSPLSHSTACQSCDIRILFKSSGGFSENAGVAPVGFVQSSPITFSLSFCLSCLLSFFLAFFPVISDHFLSFVLSFFLSFLLSCQSSPNTFAMLSS